MHETALKNAQNLHEISYGIILSIVRLVKFYLPRNPFYLYVHCDFQKLETLIKLIYHACILGLQFVTPRQQYILYSTLITGYENQVWMTLVTHGRTDCKLTAESFDLLSSCPYNSEEHKEYLNNFSPNPSKIWPRLDKF